MSQERYCPNCEDYREFRIDPRTETYTVRGRKIAIPVEAEVCVACGESLSTEEGDEKVLDQVNAAYREQENLLTPEQIKAVRRRYALSQRSFAALLGMGEATINRYEKGKLQDRPHDCAIRACEDQGFMRGLLDRKCHLLTDWQRKRVERALTTGPPGPEDRTPRTVLSTRAAWVCMPDEVTDRTGFRRFDYRRCAAVVRWFCAKFGSVPKTMMNKLLFYADFLHFKTATVSLTGSAYRSIKHGPVLADFGGLFSQMEADEFIEVEERDWGDGITGEVYHVGPNAGDLDCTFSPCELAVLEYVAGAFQGWSGGRISNRSHEETAFRETPTKELISYEKARELSLSLPE